MGSGHDLKHGMVVVDGDDIDGRRMAKDRGSMTDETNHMDVVVNRNLEMDDGNGCECGRNDRRTWRENYFWMEIGL